MVEDDIISALVILLVFIVSVAVVGVLCNPMFWQGYRNSKFLDELKRSSRKKKGEKKFNKDWLKP